MHLQSPILGRHIRVGCGRGSAHHRAQAAAGHIREARGAECGWVPVACEAAEVLRTPCHLKHRVEHMWRHVCAHLQLHPRSRFTLAG